MAKLALLTLTVFIALFFTISTSMTQHPLELPNDDSVSIHDPSITLPEPDSKRKILLPSEKPESEPATMVELEQNEKETEEIVEEEEEEKKPEMRIAFRDLRPGWPRNVDQRMMFVLRHRHHRCHHPHQHHQILFRQFDVERPEVEETERSYGNDMLVADPEMEKAFKQREGNLENDMLVADPNMEKKFEQMEGNLENDMLVADPAMEKGFEQREMNLENDMLVADPEMEKGFDKGALEQDLTEIHFADGGGRRHAPSRWVGFHFGGRPRFPDDPDHEHGPHHHRHHHHHRDEDEEHHHEHRPEEEDHFHHHREEDERRHHHDEKRPFGGRREENGGGLVKRFRKFLHQIDF